MNAIGLGLGLSYYTRVPPFALTSLQDKLLLLDARTIAGSNDTGGAVVDPGRGGGGSSRFTFQDAPAGIERYVVIGTP